MYVSAHHIFKGDCGVDLNMLSRDRSKNVTTGAERANDGIFDVKLSEDSDVVNEQVQESEFVEKSRQNVESSWMKSNR